MRVTQDESLSLLGKYEEERTHVLAVFVTPSLSVARVSGTIHVATIADAPVLVVGEDNDNKPDQIKFRLSDCVFEYGAFRESKRDDESVTHQYEGFLVVASSKGDTLSLFEPKD